MTDTSPDTPPIRFPLAIAITGGKGHGKDTVARIIVENLGAEIVRFADGLKAMLRAYYRLCGLTDAETERRIEGDLKQEPCLWLGGKTPRYAMQTLGTEWREMVWSKMWVNQLAERLRTSTVPTVTPDMRFLIEESAFDDVGGIKLRVVNPRVAADASSLHVSETEMELIRVHETILNDGTIEDLAEKVRAVLLKIVAPVQAASTEVVEKVTQGDRT